MCIQIQRQTHLPHFPGQAEGNREYGHLCSSDPGSCGPTSYTAQPHTQVSYPYMTQPMCSEHKHRVHCQPVGNGHTLPVHSREVGSRWQKHTAHLQLFVELTPVRRQHASLVPRHIKWQHGGEILCTSQFLGPSSESHFSHDTTLCVL